MYFGSLSKVEFFLHVNTGLHECVPGDEKN